MENAILDTPRDLAVAAERLLALADRRDMDEETAAILELAAAMFCTHVADWQARKTFPPGVTTQQHRKLWPAFCETFAQAFPGWDLLRDLCNGVKHAVLDQKAPGLVTRGVEWDDQDFWNASHDRLGVFMGAGETPRAVSALVRKFTEAFLAANPK